LITSETRVPSAATRNTLILLCVSVPSFMLNLDSNVVAVSLSSIAHSLHADFAAIEWVISAYTLTFATLMMPAGALADRFGRKRMLLAGLTLFTAASFLCGAAPNVAVLNAARAVQGVECRAGDAVACVSGAGTGAGFRILGIGDRRRHRAGTGSRRFHYAGVRLAMGVLREHPGRCGDDRADALRSR
jgi:MFS family permease